MIRNSLILLFAIAILSCADKESEEPLGLTAEIKGKITLLTELGQLEPAQDGATVTFRSGDQEFQAVSDEKGEYRITGIPMGTYDVEIRKPDFTSYTVRGFSVMGGNIPLYLSLPIRRPSSTKITNLIMTSTDNTVAITGVLTHNYTSSFPFVNVVFFFGESPEVSPTKHRKSSLLYFTQASGTTFSASFVPDTRLFPPGSTMYAVAYGLTNSYSYMVNPETNLIEYIGLGTTPSNTASITIP